MVLNNKGKQGVEKYRPVTIISNYAYPFPINEKGAQ